MQVWIVIAFVIFIVGLFVLLSRLSEKHENEIDSPFFRRDTFIVDWDFGIVAAKKLQRSGDGGYVYVLSTENEGQVEKEYGEMDLIPLNPHLNVIGYQIFVEVRVIAHLTKEIDIGVLTSNFEKERTKVAVLQSQLQDWQANFDSKIEQFITNQERLGKATRPSKPRPM
jgi:hypothetical protein